VQGLSRWALWFGGLAFFTCCLGQTVLGVIQPTIADELDLSASEAQWVVNSFFLTLALFAAPGGRLGDYYGHRQVLLVALSIFALGSISAAVSQGFIWRSSASPSPVPGPRRDRLAQASTPAARRFWRSIRDQLRRSRGRLPRRRALIRPSPPRPAPRAAPQHHHFRPHF
jgi:MFS family permease